MHYQAGELLSLLVYVNARIVPIEYFVVFLATLAIAVRLDLSMRNASYSCTHIFQF